MARNAPSCHSRHSRVSPLSGCAIHLRFERDYRQTTGLLRQPVPHGKWGGFGDVLPLGLLATCPAQACVDLGMGTYTGDLFLPFALAPGTPLLRMRRRGQQRVIKTRQGLFHRGRQELLERLSHRGEPQKPPPQCGQCGQSSVGPAAPITQGVDLCHEGAQRARQRQITGDAPQDRAFP